MRNRFSILMVLFVFAFSCSLKEVTDKDLEIGSSNVKILDELSLIDDEEDKTVKKVMGIEENGQVPVSKENKVLRGRVNSLEGEIDKINNDMNNLRLELVVRDGKILELKDSLSTIKRTFSGEIKPAQRSIRKTASGLSYGERYKIALGEFRKKQYNKAISSFKSLLNEDSRNVLADNCQYWMGESYYGLKEYKKALFEFEKVLTFGQSNKDDDAQLKIGLCYIQLNESDRAKEELNRLMINYPTSEYLKRAKRLISNIGEN